MSCICELPVEENSRRLLGDHRCILKSYLTVETFSFDIKTWKDWITILYFQNLSSDCKNIGPGSDSFFSLSTAFFTKIRIATLNLLLVKLERCHLLWQWIPLFPLLRQYCHMSKPLTSALKEIITSRVPLVLIYCHSTNADSQVDEEEALRSSSSAQPQEQTLPSSQGEAVRGIHSQVKWMATDHSKTQGIMGWTHKTPGKEVN